MVDHCFSNRKRIRLLTSARHQLVLTRSTKLILHILHDNHSTMNFIMQIQMSKLQRKQLHRRNPSQQRKKEDSQTVQRKNSAVEGQQTHFDELKERGKRVLKKIIPNQSISMLKKLVQMGADNIKKQILSNYKLLPVLTTTQIISQLVQKPQNNKFQEMDKELTSSMLIFQKKVHPNLENTQMGQIIRAQTDKCYRHIPKVYFQSEMDPDTLNSLLTRDKRKAFNLTDQLADHYDQVEFNVNQQVNYKMGIFMSFVNYLTSIGQLADLSINKIKGTRAKNIVIKEIVIQRANRVNLLRRRKEEIEQTIKILDKLKKLKKIQDWFMSQVQAKGKITILSLYPEYCGIHTELKAFCCPKLLCKYWDVTYYIERGYQDSFSRSLKNYLGEIIMIDQKHIQEIITPNKNLFATVEDGRRITSFQDPMLNLDESFQMEEDEVELVSKHNIERQIVSNFKLGLLKCSYSTDQICQQLRVSLEACQKKLYLLIRGDLNKTNQQSTLSCQDKRHILDKLTTVKYVRIVEYWSERMKKVVKRQFAIIERALKSIFELQVDYPEKYEIICSYLMQIIYITFAAIDQSMANLIAGRKFKQQESDSIRQVLLIEQQWEELIIDLKHSQQIWMQLEQHFSGEQQEGDPKMIKESVIEGLFATTISERRKIIEIMINGYHTTSLQKMATCLQQQEWKATNIHCRFQRIIGQILYGRAFTEDLERNEGKLLSSSLLLDRNSSSFLSQSQHQYDQRNELVYTPNEQPPGTYNFQVSEATIKVQSKQFKLLSSTISLLEAIQVYLEWAQQQHYNQKVQSLILSKIVQYFLAYNNHIKELILNKAALQYGKIKSKSITGKHLLLAYSQLKFVRLVSHMIGKRWDRYQQSNDIVKEKIDKNTADVSKKFRTVLELSIRESINKLVVDPRKEISWPVPQSIEIVAVLTRSCDYVRDILMSEQEMVQFVNVQWCALYLQKLKGQYRSVYKQIMNSNGTRKAKDIDWSDNIYWKFKELEYMVQNLSEIKEYIPGFQTILDELQEERKKVEHPH